MKRSAFTMIELLVVVAIIAILAAITLPVIARAKDSAYRGSDISNMNQLRNALQVYRVDQGAYPPALLGYVTLYSTGPKAGQVIPANELKGFLYPKRVDTLPTFKPAYERADNLQTTTAIWPQPDPRAVGSAPLLDNNGDGSVDGADDNDCARQWHTTADTVQRFDQLSASWVNSEFYKVSGYDVAEVPTVPGRTELRYALFWTKWSLGEPTCSPVTPGSSLDDPRQLGYSDPPENTVVTWNSYFRDWYGGAPKSGKRDIVLFLGGSARLFDSAVVHSQAWRVIP